MGATSLDQDIEAVARILSDILIQRPLGKGGMPRQQVTFSQDESELMVKIVLTSFAGRGYFIGKPIDIGTLDA
jgi:hypothetical protein